MRELRLSREDLGEHSLRPLLYRKLREASREVRARVFGRQEARALERARGAHPPQLLC